MQTSLKVLFLNYVPSPYRVDFFNQLCKECDLKVIYFFSHLKDRPWKLADKEHLYSYEVLFSERTLFKGYKKLCANLVLKRYDVIVLSGYSLPVEIFSIFILKLFRRTFILNSDGGFINSSRRINFIKRMLIKSAQYWLSSGKNTTATLKFYGAQPLNTCEYHFTSVFQHEILTKPISLDEKLKLRHQLGIDTDAKIITSIGQYIERKGLKYLIEAIHACPEFKIHIYLIGEGPLRKELQEEIDNSGLTQQVFLTGQKEKNEVLNYCLASDIFVLPALEDIWGLVINEALACGLPVIATSKIGAAYDLIETGENGFIVPPRDVECLRKAIVSMLSDYDLQQYSRKSLEIAQKYSIENMSSDHIHLFNKIHKLNTQSKTTLLTFKKNQSND